MKKVFKTILAILFVLLVVFAVFNCYKYFTSGNQDIKLSTSNQAYTNSDLYVSIVAQKNGVDLNDTKTKIKFLDNKGKKVKDVKISDNNGNLIISIPNIETGKYTIEADVSSSAGRDKIQKEIYVSNGSQENTTITFDKGIYKPGDSVNFRALITSKENDEPVKKDVNICIYDGNDNKVYNENVLGSDYGIVSGTFKLADEVNSGIYKLVVKTDSNETTKQFKVNPYITPKYEVSITTDKENYLVGDTAKIDIQANYFFGEPVSSANYNVYINNEKYQTITADKDGLAKITYKIDDSQTYALKVEAVDESNYYVEETSSFVAGTDIFEIDLLPEYGSLVAGRKNDIYVFTYTADKKPIKTYATISSGNTTKQVATDENGIGKFSIDVDNITNTSQYYYNYSYSNTKDFKISAENMNGEKVKKTIELDIKQKSLLLSTDKVKYNQGEDITVKLETNLSQENTKNIYFMKNDKIIKMITTTSQDTKVNLDDNYGLIDIYVTENNSSSFQKTIFIKPAKALNINIQTYKQEYEPGDDIKISFETTDENKEGVEAALLVSMLDQSILSLADNDLSIDNIKLALQDINFSNELDAATLYTSLLDDSSEQTVMALLLKQENKSSNISESIITNYNEKEEALGAALLSGSLIVIITVVFLSTISEKFRNVIKHIINILIFIVTANIFAYGIYDEYFFSDYDYGWIAVVIIGILCLAIYIARLWKMSKILFRTSLSIIISLIVGSIIAITIELLVYADVNGWIVVGVFAILLLLVSILKRVSEEKNWRINKVFEKISREIVYILTFIVALICSAIIANIVYAISHIEGINIAITILLLYFFNYKFNGLGKENMTERRDLSTKSVGFIVLVIFALFGIIAFGLAIYNVGFRTFSSSINDPVYETYDDFSRRDSFNFDESIYPETNSFDTKGSFSGAVNEASASSGLSSIIDSTSSLLESATTKHQDVTNQIVEESTEASQPQEVSQTTDEKVRNVFLESMCFIPELVAKDGRAEQNLKLSDNITTWTIQTVGNTKDGKVGYNQLDTVKVFKDFFVDFELPKNLVETDKVSIPVTVYNYTENELNVTLKIKEDSWFKLDGENTQNVTVAGKDSNLVYIPITVVEKGSHNFRVEASGGELKDIIEKDLTVTPNGYKIEKVVSSGTAEGNISEDILILDDILEGTGTAKVKLYASAVAQTVEGMENIFRMPTGCFEQISSTLYPNILALKYMEDNGIVDEKLKKTALEYINSGYQKILTYEVKGESGGYSLYGNSPAETVLTAYGLMEFSDLKSVYSVDENVTNKMTEFLYHKQNSNGTFEITGYHLGGANSSEKTALNAYITWALSETNPKDERLKKSVEYLKDELDKIDDNYTLALIANVLANVEDKEVNNVIKRLVNNVTSDGKIAYMESDIRDYYGSYSSSQAIQTTALTSMALSKTSSNSNLNKQLINYLISKKDYYGTWYSTQATILSLKALNELNSKEKLENQTIKVKVNSDEKNIEIKDNPLEYYELKFSDLQKENKLTIDIEKGSGYYEVVEEYYIPYENVVSSDDDIEITVQANKELNVNDILDAKIKLVNKNKDTIKNAMVTISIPQGFTTVEDSLMELEAKGIIEKYEMNYRTVNLYISDFEGSEMIDLNVAFRALYPVEITGLSVRAYDYYNPQIEGNSMPLEIVVN